MQVTFETALTETNPYPLFAEIARLYAEAEQRLCWRSVSGVPATRAP